MCLLAEDKTEAKRRETELRTRGGGRSQIQGTGSRKNFGWEKSCPTEKWKQTQIDC